MDYPRGVEVHDGLHDLLGDEDFVLELEGVCEVADVLLERVLVLVHEDFLEAVKIALAVVIDEVLLVFYVLHDLYLLFHLPLVQLPRLLLGFLLRAQGLAAQGHVLSLLANSVAVASQDVLLALDAEVASLNFLLLFAHFTCIQLDVELFLWSVVDDVAFFDLHTLLGEVHFEGLL